MIFNNNNDDDETMSIIIITRCSLLHCKFHHYNTNIKRSYIEACYIAVLQLTQYQLVDSAYYSQKSNGSDNTRESISGGTAAYFDWLIDLLID